MPSAVPSLVTSVMPSVIPSKIPSSEPTSVPSSAPSCLIDDFLGKTFFVPYQGACVRIDFFDGGVIAAQPSDSTCASFTPVVSGNFIKATGDRALYSGGLIGPVLIKQDPEVSEIQLEFPYQSGSPSGLEFVGHLIFPVCTAAPSLMPSLEPSNKPSNSPSDSPSD